MANYYPFHEDNIKETFPAWLITTITVCILIAATAFLINLIFLTPPITCSQADLQIAHISKIVGFIMALAILFYIAEYLVIAPSSTYWATLEASQFRIRLYTILFWGGIAYFLITPYLYRWFASRC